MVPAVALEGVRPHGDAKLIGSPSATGMPRSVPRSHWRSTPIVGGWRLGTRHPSALRDLIESRRRRRPTPTPAHSQEQHVEMSSQLWLRRMTPPVSHGAQPTPETPHRRCAHGVHTARFSTGEFLKQIDHRIASVPWGDPIGDPRPSSRVARRDTQCYVGAMKTITQREFRNNSAAVMDAVEAGETYHITRNGTEVAELRP
ncbi:MAG: type II toxin-antitoxin system Phd/YefM family antitoxin, partial [Pseudonocardiaceae bacterium]